MSVPADRSDPLAALEARGDELEAFGNAERQANAYIAKKGTQSLVDELRDAINERRRVRLGTINTIVLLRHIDRLESELSLAPMRKP